MKKILKVTIFVFLFTMVLSSFRVFALHQVGVNGVTVPALKVQVSAARSLKDNESSQKFQTITCKNNSSGADEVIQVQTYNGTNGKYSGYVSAPKNSTVTIPSANSTSAGVNYTLVARNKTSTIHTVHFAGLWIVD